MAKALPKTFKKLVVTKLTPAFSEAVELITVPMISPEPGHVVIRNRFVGVNASDINFTSGKYFQTADNLNFDCGFEGIGEVVSVGVDAGIALGQAVCYLNTGAFSEYIALPVEKVIPVPSVNSAYLPLVCSGLTAAVSLEENAELSPGKKVLVTAAAGGTGQFAVQLAKIAGCHVIGTCSSNDKVDFLKKLGCDRIINYKEENLHDVLKAEYKDGIDVIYECIGGDVFDACVNSLAVKGRLIVIGFISAYESQKFENLQISSVLPELILKKSASVIGFFLLHFASKIPKAFEKLLKLYNERKLLSTVDLGERCPSPFKGIESISRAVEYLYSRKSIGKIIVEVNPETSPHHL